MQPRFIILTTLILLCLAPTKERTNSRPLPQIKGHPIHTSYLLGLRNTVPKNLASVHKALGIQHFMTPSGLHLSVFSSLIFLLIKRGLYRFLFLLILGLLSSRFDHIDSFQRMILFAALRHNPWIKVSTRQSFLCTFIVLFPQYLTNPLSYCLSFLFLGIILCPGPSLRKLGFLIIGQFMVSFWFTQNFYLFGPLYGALLTASSFLVFPLFLIEFVFRIDFITSGWVSLLELLFYLKGPVITLPFPGLIPFLIVSSLRVKKIALALGVFLVAGKLYSPRLPQYQSPAPIGAREVIQLKNGVKLLYPNGMHCYSRLKADQWIDHCYK